MTDIVQRLRDSAKAARAIDRSALLEEAASEIERLRTPPHPAEAVLARQDELRLVVTENPTLTDAEREAIRFFSLIDGPGNVPVANIRAATLRGLLKRLGGGQ